MGRVSLCIVLFLYLVASVIALRNGCGTQANGKLCGNNQCCSSWGECGTDDHHCLRSHGCQSNCKTQGDHDTNVIAYWANYDPQANNWNLTEVGVACSSMDGGNSLEWRSKYGWTAFCGKNGPQGLAACGKCLLVTNTATGAKVTVRIVDTCGIDGLVMDEKPFDEIDTNGQGKFSGHLTVDYEFVDCGDEASSLISMIV